MEMSDFDELQSKLLELNQASSRDQTERDRLDRKRKLVEQRLANLQNRRNSLDDEESNLQNDLSDSQSALDELVDKQQQRDKSMKDLLSKLDGAKKQRNAELVDWWMRRYPQFDEMSLKQLQEWLELAARRFKPSSVSGGGGGKVRSLSVQDAEKLRLQKTESFADKHSIGTTSRSDASKDDEDAEKNNPQTLAEKQRIYINRDENNPIDTAAEVQNDEEIASPLGNRSVEKEVNDYIKDHPLPNDHDNESELDRKKLTKHYQSELEM